MQIKYIYDYILNKKNNKLKSLLLFIKLLNNNIYNNFLFNIGK